MVASPEAGNPSQEVGAVAKRQCRDKFNFIMIFYTIDPVCPDPSAEPSYF